MSALLSKINRSLMNKPLFAKILLATVVLIILPLFVTVFFSYAKLAAISQDEFKLYAKELIRQINSNLSTYLKEMDLLLYTIAADADVQKSLAAPAAGHELEKIRNMEKVAFFLNNLLSMRMENTSLVIYGYNGELFTKGNFIVNYSYDFKNSSYASRIKAHKASKIYVGSHRQEYGFDKKLVFSIIRRINKLDDGSPLGFAVLDLNYQLFNQLIGDVHLAKGRQILITGGNTVIYSNHDPKVLSAVPPVLARLIHSRKEGSRLIKLQNTKYFCTFNTIETTGWQVVSLNPMTAFETRTGKVLSVLILVALLSLALSIGIAVFLSAAIATPLKKMTLLMKKVENQDFNVAFHAKYRDEIGQLGDGFNLMVARIQNLIQTVFKAQLMEKDATIYALQSQINPHFLYNTLQSISDCAEQENVAAISTLCQCLSAIFRYNSEGREPFVRLYDELEHIKNYLYIQSVRFDNRFRVDIDIPEDLLNTAMPRFILQPLVENAISHGVAAKVAGGAIRIEAVRAGGVLELTVADNGQGIEPALLAELETALNREQHKVYDSKFLALNNVNKRLVLTYGPAFRLRIESRVGAGTRVRIRIPIGAAEGGDPPGPGAAAQEASCTKW